MLSVPSPIAFLGIIFSFWATMYLTNRVEDTPRTRSIRIALAIVGVRFIHDILDSNAKLSGEALLWQRLFFWTTALAPAFLFWFCLDLAVESQRTRRWLKVLIMVAGTGFILLRFVPNLLYQDHLITLSGSQPLTYTSRTTRPGPWYPLFSAYLGMTLGGSLLLCLRAHRKAVLHVERHAFLILTAATGVLLLGGFYLSFTLLFEMAAPIAVGQGLLCAGVLLLGYGTAVYGRRDSGQAILRDYLISGFGVLGPVILYAALLLVPLYLVRRSFGIAMEPWIHYPLVMLTPCVVITHTGLDQLRGLLDFARTNRASRRNRALLRTLEHRLGSSLPLNTILQECVRDICRWQGLKNIALFRLDGEQSELLAWTGTPPPPVAAADLRVPTLRRIERIEPYDHLQPLRTATTQYGALLLGGWRSSAAHMSIDRLGIEAVAVVLSSLLSDWDALPQATVTEVIEAEQHLHRDVQKFHQEVRTHSRPRIYIQTLGVLSVYIDGVVVADRDWRGQAGAKQHKRMLTYLLANRDRPVPINVLLEVAGGRGGVQPYVITSLKKLLASWGLEDALLYQDNTVTLRCTDAWETDTDRIEVLRADAQAELQDGHPESAIRLLRDAADLCNGRFSPNYDESDDFSVAHHAEYWSGIQHQTYSRVAELLLDQTKQEDLEAALRYAEQAKIFDHLNPTSFRLVSRIAHRLGNLTIALENERQAHILEN